MSHFCGRVKFSSHLELVYKSTDFPNRWYTVISFHDRDQFCFFFFLRLNSQTTQVSLILAKIFVFILICSFPCESKIQMAIHRTTSTYEILPETNTNAVQFVRLQKITYISLFSDGISIYSKVFNL